YRHQPLGHPARGTADQARRAAEDLDPAQAAARHGRARGDGVPSRQGSPDQEQPGILRDDARFVALIGHPPVGHQPADLPERPELSYTCGLCWPDSRADFNDGAAAGHLAPVSPIRPQASPTEVVPMEEGIHPEYRDVVFQDMASDFRFITRST